MNYNDELNWVNVSINNELVSCENLLDEIWKNESDLKNCTSGHRLLHEEAEPELMYALDETAFDEP